MTDVQGLLRQYIERFEAGGSPDPQDLLERASGKDRATLSALIEGYLEHEAPDQQWDAERFEGTLADYAVSRVAALVDGGWRASERAWSSFATSAS